MIPQVPLGFSSSGKIKNQLLSAYQSFFGNRTNGGKLRNDGEDDLWEELRKDYQTDSRQMAVGTRQQESKDEQLGKIRQQQAVRNQTLRLGLLNSDLSSSELLPAAIC